MTLENEQTQQVTTQEPAATPAPAANTSAQEAPKAPAEQPQPFKVFNTEDDFKAEVNRAKGDWLKQVGATSVDEYKAKVKQYNDAIAERDSLIKQRNDLNEKLVVNDLGVADDHREDLLTLAKSRIAPDKDLRAAAAEVLQKNPTWMKAKGDIRIGTEKPEDGLSSQPSALTSRYPWLK